MKIFLMSLLLYSLPVFAVMEEEVLKEDISEATDSSDEQFVDEEVQKQVAQSEILKTGIYWTKPDYSKQDEALGWHAGVFDTPSGFHDRVNFWINIYSKYTTKQVVLHDAKYIDLIYKILDFSEIDANLEQTAVQKENLKKKRVREEKKLIKEQLQRIHKLQDNPSLLSAEDKTVYEKFKFIPEKNKFIEAQSRHRLRMQLGQKDKFVLGVYFSGRYIREMEKIFKEEKMPVELTRLPFVESTFNLYAMSKVGASGIWQFMPGTAKLFMKIDKIKDPRNDPLEATKAAARLLRLNYKILGSWSLALTAYNHGPAGVNAVVKKMKTVDINEIVWNTTRKKFGFASENFYACFLAALHVEANAAKYFGRIEVSATLKHDDFPLPRETYFGEITQLAENIFPKEPKKDTFDILRLYNPYFTRPVIANLKAIPQNYNLRVPVGTAPAVKEILEKTASFKPKSALKNGVYKVLPGDTLSSIASEFGIKIKVLKDLNGLNGRGFIRPGQKLVIPSSAKQ